MKKADAVKRVVCETCGARRGAQCRSVKRPPGMPRGMLPTWETRAIVPVHRARVARALTFALRRMRALAYQIEGRG